MKGIIITLLMISFAFVYNSYGQSKEQPQQEEISDTIQDGKTLTYTVYGMDCPGCQGALEKQLKKIPWVTTAEANWINQEVKIEIAADSLFVEEEIYKKIRKANFTPAEKKK